MPCYDPANLGPRASPDISSSRDRGERIDIHEWCGQFGRYRGCASADSRAPVVGQGVGTFLYGPWTLIAYGCFRTGTRLFCDFDTSNQNNTAANSNIWQPVTLVDDGGKITTRHNAFFVGDDGSQFSTAYLTAQKPARFIVEYDNIDQRYTSISLVLGKEQIQAVPITQIDPNQPARAIPKRAARTNGVSN